jgi:MinD-like ATPase involved in chromosome partitioning or flagellar assembly
VFAAVRGRGVCVLETTETTGHLLARSEGGTSARYGLVDLLHALHAGTGTAALEDCVLLQSSGADVLGSTQLRDQMGGEAVRALHRAVAQQYPIVVLDTGANQEAQAFQRAFEATSALVLVTTLHVDAVLDLAETLAMVRLRGRRGAQLADDAIVVITDDGRPVDRDQARRLREVIDDLHARMVTTVPYDPHINAGRAITLGHLSEESQRAWLHVAALVVTAATPSSVSPTR